MKGDWGLRRTTRKHYLNTFWKLWRWNFKLEFLKFMYDFYKPIHKWVGWYRKPFSYKFSRLNRSREVVKPVFKMQFPYKLGSFCGNGNLVSKYWKYTLRLWRFSSWAMLQYIFFTSWLFCQIFAIFQSCENIFFHPDYFCVWEWKMLFQNGNASFLFYFNY